LGIFDATVIIVLQMVYLEEPESCAVGGPLILQLGLIVQIDHINVHVFDVYSDGVQKDLLVVSVGRKVQKLFLQDILHIFKESHSSFRC